ncbi:MAG: LuxR C-terminal-related transcriptional regulator [Oscillospiraceae bacterium]|nr:LuxR C-terminal-related transcriptional regulator [Oscillospiraceae bacterium]
MNVHELNDWMFFNNLIYKIYTIADEREMRSHFISQLKMVLDFDATDFHLAKDDGSVGVDNFVGFNSDGTDAEKYDELDYSRGILYCGKCIVYRETDIISDDIRINSEYYKKIYLKNHWHYAMQMIFARNKRFLGVLTLYRSIGKEDFTHDDIMILDMIKDHMAFRLYSEYEKRCGHTELDIRGFCEKYRLTNRETSVLEHILRGEENSEISEKLVISIHTLKKHILNIYRKAEVNNRLQLMNKVQETKFFSTPKGV